MLTPLLVLAAGCTFEENLPEVDITGTVVVPRAAATRTLADGSEVVDPRAIGPIWLGIYPSVEEAGLLFDYPHPEMGPVYQDGIRGNAYPYGGGSVGRFDYACFQSLKCKVVTGRFTDFEDILDYFENVVESPVIDNYGAEVESADYFRNYCYELFEYTADYELSFLSGFDDDGNALTSFVENPEGDFEATFNVYHTPMTQGMQLWGWVDVPSELHTFSTCDDNDGQYGGEYNENNVYYGTNQYDLLNFPSLYIASGDYVVTEPHTFTSESAEAFRDSPEEPRIVIDFPVED